MLASSEKNTENESYINVEEGENDLKVGSIVMVKYPKATSEEMYKAKVRFNIIIKCI